LREGLETRKNDQSWYERPEYGNAPELNSRKNFLTCFSPQYLCIQQLSRVDMPRGTKNQKAAAPAAMVGGPVENTGADLNPPLPIANAGPSTSGVAPDGVRGTGSRVVSAVWTLTCRSSSCFTHIKDSCVTEQGYQDLIRIHEIVDNAHHFRCLQFGNWTQIRVIGSEHLHLTQI
jgi:hypothetical protein